MAELGLNELDWRTGIDSMRLELAWLGCSGLGSAGLDLGNLGWTRFEIVSARSGLSRLGWEELGSAR